MYSVDQRFVILRVDKFNSQESPSKPIREINREHAGPMYLALYPK